APAPGVSTHGGRAAASQQRDRALSATTLCQSETAWFPRQERSLATSIFDAAAKFSNVIGIPLVALVVVQFGWRWGFGITGLLSFLYFVAFLIIYRDPSKHPRVSAEEREYIRAGGATPEGPAQSGEVAMLGYFLLNRKVWGLTIGFAAYGYSFYLFLTWLPNYLE